MMKILFIAVLIALLSTQVMANESLEKVYLLQAMNQLDALKPIILAAANKQQKNSRIKFHYTSFKDVSGTNHNGLIEDLNEIENGIQQRLKQVSTEPRIFQEIKGDYLSSKVVSARFNTIKDVDHDVK